MFSADGFADRTEQTLQSDAVTAELARRLTDAAIRAQPDLIAVRPLVEGAAEGVVRSAAFRSLVRAAARDVHRSVFDRDASTVTLTIVDAGVLLNEAIGHLRPDLARRVPDDLAVRLSGAAERATADALDVADRVRMLALVSFLVALCCSRPAPCSPPSRGATRCCGSASAVAGVAGLTALIATFVAPAADRRRGVRAVLATWLDPLALWCWALSGAGLVVASAAASILRPVLLLPLLRRAGDAVVHPPDRPWPRVARAVAAIVVGALAIADPLKVVEVIVASAGLLLVVIGTSDLLRLAGGPSVRARGRTGSRTSARVIALAAALVAGLARDRLRGRRVTRSRCGSGAATGRPRCATARSTRSPSSAPTTRWPADGEPGWLFAAQDAGIDAQLERRRPRAADRHPLRLRDAARRRHRPLARVQEPREDRVRGRASASCETAERLRTRIGYTGGGTREIFLCHAFCEVGATPALEALRGRAPVPRRAPRGGADPLDRGRHRRGRHGEADRRQRPDPRGLPRARRTAVADAARADRPRRARARAGRERPGPEPWMHTAVRGRAGDAVPVHTRRRARRADECEPNRGGTDGSLLLVNHWVDTSPAPRKTIAREVNAPDFLGPRLARCREERGLVPNIVAVDFYRQGDVFDTVERVAQPVERGALTARRRRCPRHEDAIANRSARSSR